MSHRQKRSQPAVDDGQIAALFHHAPVGLLQLAPTGGCLLSNERFCKMTGHAPSRLGKLCWSALSHPDDFAGSWLACSALLERRSDHLSFRHRLVHQSGSLIPCLISGTLFQNGHREFDSLLLSIQPEETAAPPSCTSPDKRTATEREEPHWKERYESILLATGQIVYEIDTTGDRTLFTGNTTALFGHSIAEMNRGWQHWLDLIHPDDRKLVEQLRATATPGQSYQIEYRIIAKCGKLATLRDDGCAVVVGPRGKTRLVGVLVDISEQQGLAAQLHHAQKMEVFGRLAGGVAHDFNNLLTVFSGYTDLLMTEFGEHDPRREYLEEMQRASERASALTSQLLAFGRLQRFAPREINLKEVVLDLKKMLRRLIGEDIELVIHAPESLGLVFADPRQIETVLINLVVNARDAMPHGGRLSIDLSQTTLRSNARRVARAGWKPGAYIVVEVSDTGIGIDPALSSKIFEPFFTTKAPGEGTGLGLATCYGIIEQCGGRIEVDSTPGKGSTFRTFLPRIQTPSSHLLPPILKKNGRRARIPRGKGETILLVEDDLAVQKTYSTMLRRLGYTVIAGSNGDEALRIAMQHPEIRLVITDLVMPLMSGTDLAEELRHILPKTRVVLTSGYASEPVDSVDAQTPFLPKPLSRDILAHTLRELLETD